MARKKRRTTTANRGKKKYSVWSLLIILVISILTVVQNFEEGNPKSNQIERSSKKKNKKNYRALKTFTGKVISVKDGDTFEVLYDGEPERVRLAEIDCPEKAQPYGNTAKRYASDLCYGEIVTVKSGGKRDRYGRVVGTVITQDGVNVNEQLIKAGLAWHYKDYSNNEMLGILEEHARKEKVGLWSDKNPTAPWQYRKNKRKKKRR